MHLNVMQAPLHTIEEFPLQREMQEHLESVHRVRPDVIQSRLDRCRELLDFSTGLFD